MKKLKKVLIISVIFILIFSTFVFAYEFESMKTFFEESLEDYSEEQEWYDENNLPYRVKVVSDNDDGYEYEYYNCFDEEDWKRQGNEKDEEIVNNLLDNEDNNYDNSLDFEKNVDQNAERSVLNNQNSIKEIQTNIFYANGERNQLSRIFSENDLNSNCIEIQWCNSQKFPYKVKLNDTDIHGGSLYKYYNCSNNNDYMKKMTDEILKQYNIERYTFYGRRKEQCPTEELLFKMGYYKIPFLAEEETNLNSASQFYYDDAKMAYYYPVKANNDYISFVVMTQDGLNEYGNTIFIVQFCQFTKEENGEWSCFNKKYYNCDECFDDVQEKNKYKESYRKALIDIMTLGILMKVNYYSNIEQYDAYGYVHYILGNNQENSTIYLKKSDYVIAQENAKKQAAEEQAKLKNSKFHGTYASQLNNYELQCAELTRKISNASSYAEKHTNAILLKTIATSASSFAKSIYALTEVDRQDKDNAMYTFSDYLYIAYSAGG